VTDYRIREHLFGECVTGVVRQTLKRGDQRILDELTPYRDFGGTEALK
jgi:hypothetical protein